MQFSRSQALGMLAAGAAMLPRAARAQSAPVTVRIGTVNADTYAGCYYALDLGLFLESRIERRGHAVFEWCGDRRSGRRGQPSTRASAMRPNWR